MNNEFERVFKARVKTSNYYSLKDLNTEILNYFEFAEIILRYRYPRLQALHDYVNRKETFNLLFVVQTMDKVVIEIDHYLVDTSMM